MLGFLLAIHIIISKKYKLGKWEWVSVGMGKWEWVFVGMGKWEWVSLVWGNRNGCLLVQEMGMGVY